MTIQFGLNDCNCWETDRGLPRVSEAAFVANLVEMIERGRVFGASEIVLSTNHRTLRRDVLPCGDVYEDRNAHYSETVREVADETGVVLCDIRAAFEPFGDEELAACCCRPRTCCTSAQRATRSTPRRSGRHSSGGSRLIGEESRRGAAEDRDRPPLERPRGVGRRRHRSQPHGHLPARPRVRLRRPYLEPETRILEVGCGNGFSTERFRELVDHVDAIDYAENMIERAREARRRANNRFIHDNILEPQRLGSDYDAVVCVRVLINLHDFDAAARVPSRSWRR